MNTLLKFNQQRLALSTLSTQTRQFGVMSYSAKGKSKHSQRIGKDYRVWFGCIVVVPE